MSSLYIFNVIFFCLFVVQKSFGEIQSYQCKQGILERWCTISVVNHTSSQEHFTLIPHRDVSEVKGVVFVEFQMEVLTEDVCDSLPNVDYFSAISLGLTSVDENALKKCTKLEEVHLGRNLLTSLPLRLLDSNVELSEITLYNNKLTKIDGDFFKHNPKLEQIDLDNNQLRELTFSTQMPSLKRIFLKNNALSDVDVDALLEKCPNLEEIRLNGSKFTCDRQKQIIKAFNAKNITYEIGECIH